MTRSLSVLALIAASLLVSTPLATGLSAAPAAGEAKPAAAASAVEDAKPTAAAPPVEEAKPTAAAPPAIRVAVAARRELVETLSVTGTVVAREEAAVGTDLNGLTVLELRADQGDLVKKGDVLAVLDRSLLETELAQADANRAQAEANIAQMEAQIADAEIAVRQAGEGLDRSKTLKGKGVATQAQLDNSVNAADSARARLLSATKAVAVSQAQLAVMDAQTENVRLQIEKTELRAPADGLVLTRAATLGGVVSAAGAPLFRIAIDGEFELAADVAETTLPRLAVEMTADVTLAGLDQPLAGSIRRISPEIDQASRLGSIRISLGAQAPARTGNFARAEIEVVRRDGVAIPSSAVVFRGAETFLQVVEDGAIASTPVKLGVRAGDFVEVVSGLSEGQEVVSKAGTFVADGDRVTPVREETTGAIKP